MAEIKCYVVLLVFFIGSQSSWAQSDAIEAGSKNATTVSSDLPSQERLAIYESSIKYWDTNDPEVRKSILKELATGEAYAVPGCPRIGFPLICDSEGTILENICYFRMKRRLATKKILPVMIFTTTPIEEARPKCEKEFGKRP